MPSIQYIPRPQIDTLKWNSCIEKTHSGLVYGYSWFLDHMAVNWDAIVVGEYEAVLALPWNKKWGIRYVYTPPFAQRLGLWGSVQSSDVMRLVYELACRHFSFIDLMIDLPADFSLSPITQKRINYILPLNKDYLHIQQHYTEECKRNLRKATNRRCEFINDVPVGQVVGLYRKAYGHYSSQYNAAVYDQFAALAGSLKGTGNLISAGVVHGDTHELLFGALVFRSGNRLYYLMGAPTEEGRKARATYFFIDYLVQQFAGNELIFDFEGSDIPDVAAFYQRFGPQQEDYYHWRYNGLPWFVKWMKKSYRF